MNESDLSRLQDMLESALAAQEFAQGKTRHSLDNDKQFQYALRKALELIGEAASKVTQETRNQHPQIAWQPIIGMRNVLTHIYMHIDYDRVWDVVVHDLPPLISELEKIIPPETP
ncbi:MAG: DUF86 domain-containing protein [Chloroflexi bacterium]|nr:DUF86 domain-containing protein [Chloroflexota bacterium]